MKRLKKFALLTLLAFFRTPGDILGEADGRNQRHVLG